MIKINSVPVFNFGYDSSESLVPNKQKHAIVCLKAEKDAGTLLTPTTVPTHFFCG